MKSESVLKSVLTPSASLILLLGLTFSSTASATQPSYYEEQLMELTGSEYVRIINIRDRLAQFNPLNAFRNVPHDFMMIEFEASQKGGATYNLKCKMDVIRVGKKITEYRIKEACKVRLVKENGKKGAKVARATALTLFKLPAKIKALDDLVPMEDPKERVTERMTKDIGEHYENLYARPSSEASSLEPESASTSFESITVE